MANSPMRRAWRPRLTTRELRRGWVFFGLYIVLFPYLMAGVRWVLDERWGLYLPDASASVAYFGLLAATLLLLLWDYLRQGFFLLLDRLPENLLAVASGFLLWLLLRVPAGLLSLPAEDTYAADYSLQFLMDPGATAALLVLLMPLTEEILFRGLLFGSLRGVSRTLAWALSVLLFALYSVWQPAFAMGDWRYLLLAVRWLPAGFAVTWAYDLGGSVWSAIFLRMLIGGVSLFLIVSSSGAAG